MAKRQKFNLNYTNHITKTKQQKLIFSKNANAFTYGTIENYLKIKNYEILAWKLSGVRRL